MCTDYFFLGHIEFVVTRLDTTLFFHNTDTEGATRLLLCYLMWMVSLKSTRICDIVYLYTDEVFAGEGSGCVDWIFDRVCPLCLSLFFFYCYETVSKVAPIPPLSIWEALFIVLRLFCCGKVMTVSMHISLYVYIYCNTIP